MTAAYRLRGAGWLIACVAIVLGFYLVSLRVAAERKKVEAADARIAAAQRDIRALETEFDTRANMAQLERWNGDTLALAAPTAAQFVSSGAALAAIDLSAPMPAAAGATRTAALVVPAAVSVGVTPAAAAPPVTVAAATPPPAPRTAAPTIIRVAAMRVVAPGDAGRDLARLAGVDRPARARPRTVALLDGKLLSDATLGDLLAKARHEARAR